MGKERKAKAAGKSGASAADATADAKTGSSAEEVAAQLRELQRTRVLCGADLNLYVG